MSKETLTFLLGIALVLLPFLGIPETWKQYTIASIGAMLIVIGYALRRGLFLRNIENEDGERASDSFVETTETLFAEEVSHQSAE